MLTTNPRVGDTYIDKKGVLYQIQSIATYVGNGKTLIIYQEKGDKSYTFAMDYDAFVQEFSDADAKTSSVPNETNATNEKKESIAEGKDVQNSPLLRFLDTDDFDEKYEILCQISERDITDVLINNLAVTLDVVIPDGPIDKRFNELKTCVKTRKKYESMRLR